MIWRASLAGSGSAAAATDAGAREAGTRGGEARTKAVIVAVAVDAAGSEPVRPSLPAFSDPPQQRLPGATRKTTTTSHLPPRRAPTPRGTRRKKKRPRLRRLPLSVRPRRVRRPTIHLPTSPRGARSRRSRPTRATWIVRRSSGGATPRRTGRWAPCGPCSTCAPRCCTRGAPASVTPRCTGRAPGASRGQSRGS